MADIRDWLETLGLGAHESAFIDNDVDLEALPHLTEAMLKEMGLSIGVRAKVKAGIEALKSTHSAPQTASNAAALASGEQRGPRVEAERRHLTVMFCDLVGFTALAEAMDPEDLRALIGSYQTAARRVIERYDGYVAQYLGDGILAYFGWPSAHEDDAERALRAAIDLVLKVKLVEAPAPIQVRIGIATGLVVVGESDGGAPNIAVGETPNLAARLQSLAGVDEIIIDAMTRRLVGGVFELEDTGSHLLKGFTDPVHVSRVVGLARTAGRFDSHREDLTPFVGREPEIGLLLDRWANAKDGEGQAVLVEGEPGFGKSRLVRELCERIKDEPHAQLRYQCSPYHTSSALHPIIEQLERETGFQPGDDVETRLDKLEAILPDAGQTRALFASLLSLHTRRYEPLGLTPQKQKEQTLLALVGRLEELSLNRPVLLIIEDAHWLDPTTQEVLDLQLSEVARLRVLAIVTFRPEYKAPWLDLSHATPMRLTRLGKRYAKAMVETVGTDLPDALRAEIVARTDGIPLFVEEMTNAVRNSSLPEEPAGRFDVQSDSLPLGIPWTLQNSLTARLDQLGAVKELAQVAACIGRHFSRTLLAAIRAVPVATLDQELSTLIASGLVFPERSGDEARFAFKHFLIQQAAYASLLNRTRLKIHAEIAAVLIARHEQNPGSDPIVIAQHLRAAQQTREALPWLRRAAERAANSGSVQESLEILDRALEALDELKVSPEERDRTELETLLAKLPVCIAIKGWASDDANTTCSRALGLAVSLGDKPMESSILYQIATMHEVRGEYSETQKVLARRHRILPQPPEPEPEVESGELMACSTFYQGRFETSIEHAIQALHYADPQRHTVLGATLSEDPTIACLFWLAKSLLLKGEIGQALERQREAFGCARRSPNWYAESQADVEAALLFSYRRDFAAALDQAERAISSSERVGLAYRAAVATLIYEWASAATSRQADLAKLHASLNVFRQVGAMIGYGFYLGLAAEAHAQLGETVRSDELLRDALQSCKQTRGFFYESELHRLEGYLRQQHSGSLPSADAERCYKKALQIAKAQGAILFELRAANALARLLLEQGQHAKARDLITPVYARFVEGAACADVVEAKALLKEVG